MVDLTSRLKEIKAMVDRGDYFIINRARQYGKTTTLQALETYLQDSDTVIRLDFQRIESVEFESGNAFVRAFAREIRKRIRRMTDVPETVRAQIDFLADGTDRQARMAELLECFSEWCEHAKRPLVLIIDEVDTASNNQVFLDFLSQLRAAYLDRDITPTFQSVILAGVYDVRSIRRKIRPDEEHKTNSPWNIRVGNEENGSLLPFDDCARDYMELAPYNIAVDFLVDMSFSQKDITGMLDEYESDYHTGMNTDEMSQLLFDYTSGYPYLVSRLCKLLDEQIFKTDKTAAWTKDGFLEAVKLLLNEQNPLFDSLIDKLTDYPELSVMISRLLFQGQSIAYNPDDPAIRTGQMFGFVRIEGSHAVIANRIFETRLYNYFLLKFKEQNSDIYAEGTNPGNHFVIDGHLNVRRILEKFVETFNDLYGDQDETFLEDAGRRYFLLFLKPIINGVGNSYVEAQTRNRERMDLVIDYRGEQFIIEMKIWRGNAYNERGEEQLTAYLNYFHLNKGYMLSFNFNRKKEIGVRDIVLGDKLLVEAVV
ncbi:MAG: ATP-binding protein [Clostridiales bacterium]|nr:ATP-binding protein [Clostridiales bacterium]